MQRRVYVAGTGMVPFVKPGSKGNYVEWSRGAISMALSNAGVSYQEIKQAYAGYVYGNSCSGQRAIYDIGMTGIPVINVNNNCATGSTALFLARQAIECGAIECALVLGFEQMQPGAISEPFNDQPSPFDHFDKVANSVDGVEGIPLALKYFGGAGLAYMEEHDINWNIFAKVRAKASRHAEHNPMALFRKVVSEDEVMASPIIWPDVMTRLMACPPTCGAAAAILCSEDFRQKHHLQSKVWIAAQSMVTDTPKTFSGDMRDLVGYNISQQAAIDVYEASGVCPEDIDLVELHDCFAHNELISYESLGLCEIGHAEKFVTDKQNTYGGKVVVNPSGGLLSKGHPLGATGLAQCVEIFQQLSDNCGRRQVDNARIGLQHNIGVGGACVVTLYQRD